MQVESTHLPVGGALTSLAHHIYTTVLLSQTKDQGIQQNLGGQYKIQTMQTADRAGCTEFLNTVFVSTALAQVDTIAIV